MQRLKTFENPTHQELLKLSELAQNIGIHIERNGDFWTWNAMDENGITEIGPYRLCIDPRISIATQAKHASRFVIDISNF